MIVVVTPIMEEDARFAEGIDQFAIQALGPEAAIEALDISILPGASRIDVNGLDAFLREPALDGRGNELRSVVTANITGSTFVGDDLLKQFQDIDRFDRPVGVDAVAFPRILIDEVENAQFPTPLGEVADEVPRPDMIAMAGLLWKPSGEPLTALSRLGWGHL